MGRVACMSIIEVLVTKTCWWATAKIWNWRNFRQLFSSPKIGKISKQIKLSLVRPGSNKSWFLSGYYSDSTNNATERYIRICRIKGRVHFLGKRGSLKLSVHVFGRSFRGNFISEESKWLTEPNRLDLPGHKSISWVTAGLIAKRTKRGFWPSDPGGWGLLQKNWVVVCDPLPKTLTQFMTKIWDIPYPIYDLTLTSKSCFRPALYWISSLVQFRSMLDYHTHTLWGAFVDFSFH